MIQKVRKFTLYKEWGMEIDGKFPRVTAKCLPAPQVLDPLNPQQPREFAAYEKRLIEHFEELVLDDGTWCILHKAGMRNKVVKAVDLFEKAGKSIGVSIG